jgi:predicted aldo/keto reductase-like oxidoreductase
MGWESWYSRNKEALKKYENCQECRQCESKCPYQLPILELMAEKVTWLRKQYGSRMT